MKLLGKGVLEDFSQRHVHARPRLLAWAAEMEAADWRTPHDLKARYPQASLLGDKQVVFNIGGNAYRLVAKLDYERGIVLVTRIGTHDEYSSWDL